MKSNRRAWITPRTAEHQWQRGGKLKKSLWSALETAPSLDAFGSQWWQKDDLNCGRRVFAVYFPRFPSSLDNLTLLVSFLRSIRKLLRGVLQIVIPNSRHPPLFSFFSPHAMQLYLVLIVVSLNAVAASAVTGLICSLKVGVVLTSACLCSFVATCRPLVWLFCATTIHLSPTATDP